MVSGSGDIYFFFLFLFWTFNYFLVFVFILSIYFCCCCCYCVFMEPLWENNIPLMFLPISYSDRHGKTITPTWPFAIVKYNPQHWHDKCNQLIVSDCCMSTSEAVIQPASQPCGEEHPKWCSFVFPALGLLLLHAAVISPGLSFERGFLSQSRDWMIFFSPTLCARGSHYFYLKFFFFYKIK